MSVRYFTWVLYITGRISEDDYYYFLKRAENLNNYTAGRVPILVQWLYGDN